MDEKNALLEGDSNWDLHLQYHLKSQETAHPEPQLWRRSIRLLQFCVLLLALAWLGHNLPQRWTSKNYGGIAIQPYTSHVPHSMPQPGLQFERCTRYTTLETHRFEFNISTKDSNQWQLLDSADAERRKHLHGRIIVQQGPELQYSDIEVKAVLSSNDETDLDRLVLRDSKSALAIEYNLDESIVMADLCTEIELLVYLRPNRTQSVDIFEIRSNILDIWFKESLTWKVHNVITHTSYGETTMEAFLPTTERMVAHNVSVSSTYGLIFGQLIAPKENLELRNEDGKIGIFLLPDYLSPSTTFGLDSISISTVSGDIAVIGVFDVPWPEKDYTHRLSVSTDSGSIRSQAPHGSFTNYSSNSGDVTCYLRPYGTKYQDAISEIYTTTQSGALAVRVSEAFELGNKRHNPNHNTNSEHSVENGTMKLSYGYDWLGELEADIRNGVLDFDGSSLDNVERGEGYVKAKRGQRGKTGKSHINAHVGNGQLDIKLGLGP
ncbi:hypothetical protein BDV96DRAFT_554397 [Lophiotrema nucula]|uniref:Uncharacterized protein n=1 Tax=Lophiotrema nucula TaxID=690887 RepID=A0A6A5YR39_9PLEO|nr:hypothetical protein BDV96DRAFT_554397 [Lophiotrema nucula]